MDMKEKTWGDRAAQRGLAVAVFIILTTNVHAETFRIELDYMVDSSPGGHSHMPSTAVIDAVVQMFACEGHTLIIDVSDAIPHHNVLQMDPEVRWRIFEYDGVPDSYGALKSTWYDHAGVAGWHYCIFGHQYEWIDSTNHFINSTSSGLAELNGDDLMVTLGTFTHNGLPIGSPFAQASTLAHEFGHNLGLMHCGTMDCGNDETTPEYVGSAPLNLASIMSYMYQLRGVQTNLVCQGLATSEALFKDLDYSHGTMCSLDENALDEPWGTMLRSVDWNCSTTIGGTYPVNVSGGDKDGWCSAGAGVLTVLEDYDEWANITDATKDKDASELKNMPVEVCISSDEMKLNADKITCPEPTLVSEDCITAEMRYVRFGMAVSGVGTCEDARAGVVEAVIDAPAGSVLILEPGEWVEGAMILGSPLILTAPYSAVIR